MSLVAELQLGQDHENQKMICMNIAFFKIKGLYKKQLCKSTNHNNFLQTLCPLTLTFSYPFYYSVSVEIKNNIQSVVNAFVICMYYLFSFNRENKNYILIKNY